MPPRKKTGPDMAFLAELLKESTGEEVRAEDIEDYATISNRKESENKQRLLEKEGVLRMLHHKHGMLFKSCQNCKRSYSTQYCYQDFCSDSCRDEAFEKKYGISYAQLRTKPKESFWEYEPVLSVSAGTLDALYEYAQWFIDNMDELRRRSQEEDQRRASESPVEDYDPAPLVEADAPSFQLTTLDTFDTAFQLEGDDSPPAHIVQDQPGPLQSDPSFPDFGEFDDVPFQ